MTMNPTTVRMFAHAPHGHTIGENQQMHMATGMQQWTRADLEWMPDDGNRYEVVRGELFVTPAPAVRHQRLVLALIDVLRRYVERMRLGEVDHAPSAVVLDESEVQPDIVVRTRVSPPPPTWDEMPLPFLVVEILSTSTKRRDGFAKRSLYLESGIEEYWIVDGVARSIRVIRKDFDQVLTETLSWHPTAAHDAMTLDIAAMFREALE